MSKKLKVQTSPIGERKALKKEKKSGKMHPSFARSAFIKKKSPQEKKPCFGANLRHA